MLQIVRQHKIDRKQQTRIHLIISLVSHATRNPHGPADLFGEDDNQKGKSITKIMQEKTHTMVPLLPTRHNLGAYISRIVNRRHMPNDGLSHRS
jgi:hypothetical protein